MNQDSKRTLNIEHRTLNLEVGIEPPETTDVRI